MIYSAIETTCFGLYWPSSGFYNYWRGVYIYAVKVLRGCWFRDLYINPLITLFLVQQLFVSMEEKQSPHRREDSPFFSVYIYLFLFIFFYVYILFFLHAYKQLLHWEQSDQGIDIEISKSTTPHNFYSIYRLLFNNCRNLKMANKGRNM